MKLHFEARELPTYAEPLSAGDLKEGSVYFMVNYVDEKLLFPKMETVVYAGKDLHPDDAGRVYFQDIGSYMQGIRFGTASKDEAVFYSGAENQTAHIFEYERALEELMRCSLMRRKMTNIDEYWKHCLTLDKDAG